MAKTEKRTPPEQPRSEHLSLRPDDGRPAEVRFGFEGPQSRIRGALGGSLIGHAGIVVAWLLFVWLVPDPIPVAILPDSLPREIVWLADPGPGAGGGGGKSRAEPAQTAQPSGEDEINVLGMTH